MTRVLVVPGLGADDRHLGDVTGDRVVDGGGQRGRLGTEPRLDRLRPAA
jgi:hypothetical protein